MGSNYPWRVRDVFYVILLYFIILTVFTFLEAKVIGNEIFEEKSLSVWVWFLEEVFDSTIITVLPIIFVVKYYKADVKEIGVTLENVKRNILAGAIVGIISWGIASIFYIAITKIFGQVPPHPYIQKLEMTNSPMSYLAVLTSIIALGPVSEEVFVRGFAYTIFRKRYGKSIGIILSALIFTGLHFNLSWAVPIMILGIILGFLYESTRSLASVIVAHSSINMLSIFVGGL
jgi:membrane protease YdiL (CAAX protease family)